MKRICYLLLLCSTILLTVQVQAQNSIQRIDSLTHLFMEQTMSQPLGNLSAEQVLNLSEEQFNTMVAQMGSSIPFKYDASVLLQMSYMKHPNSTFLSKAWSRKNLYFRVFEEVLDKKGMPDEIKYLSIVESLLSANAVSWCGATGLWQFMPATGRMMDLQITDDLDERKDIYKSTEKACDYLLSMYGLYHDWLLALAAYNGGPGNVNKAIRASGGKHTFWEVKKYLPKETQNYVPKFLATAFLMTFSPPSASSNNLLQAHETLVPVYMCCKVDMKLVCALVNVTESEQLEWNSAYKSGVIPSSADNKKIVLPYQKAMQLAEWQDSVYTISNNAFNPEDFISKTSVLTHHVVGKGQTLAQIANKYGVSASNIKKWNNLKSSKLKAGKNLRIFKTETIQMPVTTQHPLGLLYYITDSENQSLMDICGRFSEFDLVKTCAMNAIDNPQVPIGKGKLIKLYIK